MNLLQNALCGFLVTLNLVVASASVSRADLQIYPPHVNLDGPESTQRLVIVEQVDGRATADLSDMATYSSSDPKVVSVNQSGEVQPVGEGNAVVTVAVGSRTSTVSVRATRPRDRFVPSFRNHIEPILTRTGCNSGACHGALAGKGGLKLSLRAFDPDADHFVLTRQALARRTDTAAPAESLILKKATRTIKHGGGARFDNSSEHYKLLHDWITMGAPGPKESDPQLVRLDVFPPAALLAPKRTLQLIVRATYSDKTTADVTRWVKFVSSGEPVATVDEDGKVTAAGPGEAGVSAIYGTRVATMTVTSPFPNSIAANTYQQARVVNFVDGFVLSKLRTLHLEPSPDCTDVEFVRRAFLDTCGILPTPEEVTAFLAARSPDKRAELVDRLLARPEYVDYWTHKWSDLLLVSSRKLPQPAVWSFYRFVRESVAENRPWNDFAREVLTSSGSTLSRGGGNYFLLHKDVTDLVESTSVTFLGMSIQCARCHNHPLEKWTQDQYWQMANLFARVGLKNGGRPNEVIVQSLTSGEALHLRRGVPMPPAPLDGVPLALDSSTDRREYFANWLTAPNNPYFAKALVNRVWRNFLGRGLVEAEDDLRETNPPSNTELLDALTKEFITHNYDVKHLVRTILNSATYQRSSRPLPGNVADDRYYSRYLIRRLPAEVILDAYTDVTGVPTPFDTLSLGPSGGTSKASYPRGTRAMQLPDSLLVSAFLDSFGRAEREQTCSCERTEEPSVTQALHLNNGNTLNSKLQDPNSQVSKWLDAGATDAEIVDRVFRHALSRPPTDSESKRIAAEFATVAASGPKGRREAIEDIVWAVLTGKEFLFNH